MEDMSEAHNFYKKKRMSIHTKIKKTKTVQVILKFIHRYEFLIKGKEMITVVITRETQLFVIVEGHIRGFFKDGCLLVLDLAIPYMGLYTYLLNCINECYMSFLYLI